MSLSNCVSKKELWIEFHIDASKGSETCSVDFKSSDSARFLH